MPRFAKHTFTPASSDARRKESAPLRLEDSQHYREEADVRRIGEGWKSFTKALIRIRSDGYCVTSSELSIGRKGIAAPIFDEQRRVLGSVTLIGDAGRFESFNPSCIATVVCEAAAEISGRIVGQVARPPEALAIASMLDPATT